jgi:hypothetical protein
LFIARTTTFDDSSKQLRALPRLGQDLHDDNIFLWYSSPQSLAILGNIPHSGDIKPSCRNAAANAR